MVFEYEYIFPLRNEGEAGAPHGKSDFTRSAQSQKREPRGTAMGPTIT